jgi:predicted transcriptional regulator
MRTTIEITDEHRAALVRIAASRGSKGFSSLVEEALDEYLARRVQDSAVIAAALGVRGALTDREAAELADECSRVRAKWR